MRLSQEQIVRIALRLLNEVGLDGLTVRRLAAELDVQAPALYWHFTNKQALLDEMATTMLRDAIASAPSPDPAQPWLDWLAETARGQRRMLLAYRDGAKVFSGTFLTDNTLYAPMEMGLRRLTEAGLSLRDAVRALSTIYSFTVGFTIEQQAVYIRPGERSAQYYLAVRAQRIDAQALPLAHAAGPDILGDFDERFEHGLRLILSGIAQSLAQG